MKLGDRVVDMQNSPTPTEPESSPLRPGQALHRTRAMLESVECTTTAAGLSLETLQPGVVSSPTKEPESEEPKSSE